MNDTIYVNGHIWTDMKWYLKLTKSILNWGSIAARIMVGAVALSVIGKIEMSHETAIIISVCFFCYAIQPIIYELLSISKFRLNYPRKV